MSLDKYKATKKLYEQTKKQMRRQVSEAFREAAQAVFAENPDLKSFGWDQYTPYFNDGDECVFRVYLDDLDINGKLAFDWDESSAEGKAASKLVRKVSSFLKQFSEDDLREVFGDHKHVLVTRRGIKITDADHE